MTIITFTITERIPVVEYNGNGAIVKFDWAWEMIADSSIHVRVDGVPSTDWHLQGQSVIFDTAPTGLVTIYRQTKIWMPEDYVNHGRFHSSKTELSADRIIMILQEIAGDRGKGNLGNGIIGKANIYAIMRELFADLISERGDDTVIPLWKPKDAVTPPPPGSDIVWDGADIVGGEFSLTGNVTGVTTSLDFHMDGTVTWNEFNTPVTDMWLVVGTVDGEYWMRVTELDPKQSGRTISDGDFGRASGEVFQINARSSDPSKSAFVSVSTVGDTPPSTRKSYFLIEICKGLNGLPDNQWVGRKVSIESIFSAVPPSTLLRDGAVSHWSLDEAIGTRKDAVGSNDLTPTNGDVQRMVGVVGYGMSGGALGIHSYLEIINSNSLKGGDRDYTIAIWAQAYQPGKYLLGRSDGNNTASGLDYRVGGGIGTGAHFRFSIGTSTGMHTVVEDISKYSDAVNYLFIVSHETATNTIRIWAKGMFTFDGSWFEEVSSDVSLVYTGTPNDLDVPFRIGDDTVNFWEGNQSHALGLIDEVTFWNRLLTDADKDQYYNNNQGVVW